MTSRWSCGILRAGPPGRPAGTLVVKFGGSLLGRPGWAAAFAELMATRPQPPLVVVGGGPLVDGLRAIDAAEPQPAAAMHWRAIEALGITARIVAEAAGLPLVEAPRAATAAVLDVPAWLRHDGRLPVGWHVTSDSIAAVAAAAIGADLLLAKSVPPPRSDLRQLAASGWLDPHFPEVAAGLCSIAWAAPLTPTPPPSSAGH